MASAENRESGSLAKRSERRLIREAQGGSEEAIERLFEAYWPRAYRAAYLVARDRLAAEDIAQEAFLAAIRKLDSFDRRRPFGPWIHRIAVNRAIDFSRSRALRAEGGPDALETVPGEGLRPEQEPEPDPRAATLHAALAGLSPEHRAIVAMRYILDLTPGEIAAELDLPRGTVNSRLRRALDNLAEELPS